MPAAAASPLTLMLLPGCVIAQASNELVVIQKCHLVFRQPVPQYDFRLRKAWGLESGVFVVRRSLREQEGSSTNCSASLWSWLLSC